MWKHSNKYNRVLTIKTGNSQVSNSWYQDIISVSQSESTAAVDFITLNRFESFAPVREECYSNWLILFTYVLLISRIDN